MDEKSIVLEALKNSPEPLANGQIAELTNLDKKVVEKVMKKLKDEELIVSPKRCYWTAK